MSFQGFKGRKVALVVTKAKYVQTFEWMIWRKYNPFSYTHNSSMSSVFSHGSE